MEDLLQHKHCKKCGNMIIPSFIDIYIVAREVFARDVAYGNGFCENCIEEFGLEVLVNANPYGKNKK